MIAMTQPKYVEDNADGRLEPILEVLARIRVELEEIARRIDRNQSLIARTTWAHGAADADYVKAMQDADLSAQRIAGLANYIHAIAEASQPHWRVETNTATSRLTLAEMARSMSAPEHSPAYVADPDSGEVDLF